MPGQASHTRGSAGEWGSPRKVMPDASLSRHAQPNEFEDGSVDYARVRPPELPRGHPEREARCSLLGGARGFLDENLSPSVFTYARASCMPTERRVPRGQGPF